MICTASSVTVALVSCQRTNAIAIDTSTDIDVFVRDMVTEDTIVLAAEADTENAVGMWGSAQLNIANFRYNCADDSCDLTQATIETVPAPYLSCASLDDDVPHIQYVFDIDSNTLEISTQMFKGSTPDRQWADRDTDVDTILSTAQQQIEADTYTLSLSWIGEWVGTVILDENTAERLDFGE